LNPAAVIRLGAKRPVYKEGLNSEVPVTLGDVDLALLPRFQGLQSLTPVLQITQMPSILMRRP
jgi:hypothetical protein